jgi:arginyl-tRNA synthetase
MAAPFNPFAAAAAAEVGRALALPDAAFVVTAPPRPELGDYAVGCFPAAKTLRAPPAALAARVAAAFAPTALLARAEAAGPFVNFRARRVALFDHLFAATVTGTAKLVPTTVGAGATVCIDYSSPNVAKHLAYHHIRSTVIGHALCNLHRALGYRVIGINHLGDWGTTHGILLAARERWGAPTPLTITALNDLYVRFHAAMKDDPTLEEPARRWFVRLEEGDAEARTIWQELRDVSLREFGEVYDQLGIRFEEIRGESEYEAAMPGVIALLAEKRLTAVSEGALVVPLGDDMPPLLLKKQDGATLYATRDLAAALYRFETYGFARSLYVVGHGQALHFRQLFSTLRKAGFAWADRCAHVPFGLVRIGGKKTSTRTGNVVLLREVLAEAEAKVSERIRAQNPDLPPAEVAAIARAVGTGAVVFANLVSQREKDVDFSWEDILSFEGDAGPYIQYAHARCAAILRKAGGQVPALADVDAGRLTASSEWAVAKQLMELGDVVARTVETSEPHILCRYLLDLCGEFSRFYTAGTQDAALRVLGADPATTRARLALTAAVRHVLAQGLALLGLQAPTVM